MSGRSEFLYWILFQEIQSLIDWKWYPKTIIVDFEMALLKAVRGQFKESRVVGCFFHYMQAIIRKMKKCKINDLDINLFSYLFKIPTIINPKYINLVMKFIKEKIPAGNVQWDDFMKYFETTWLKKYGIELWNIYWQNDEGSILRTNNALERYNRRLNELFSTPHPGLFEFVSVLVDEELYYTLQMRKMRSGEMPRKIRNDIEMPCIDDDFIQYARRAGVRL
jgi:hypothetical protein